MLKESPFCPICGVFLKEPYIHCAECKNPPRSLCLQCFAKGKEYENHHNNHSYSIRRNNFTLFDPEWMASEELKLLDAISECGFGNWEDVAKHVGSKNKNECEEHYLKCYACNPKPPLPVMPKLEIINEIHPAPIPCTSFSQDPPRPIVGSSLYQEMAGYMPARGEFVNEYDDYAELDIKDLNFSNDDSLRDKLQRVALDIYRFRLKERARRKLIIKNYGLISLKRNYEELKRYSILGKAIQDKMKTFMRLFPPDDFDKFMAGILWEAKVKQRIKILQDCRESGITRLHSVSTYLRLKKKREERKRTRTALDEVLSQLKDETTCHQFLRRQMLKENSQGLPDMLQGARRAAPPLNVSGMPGSEKLTQKEKELCGSIRILPSSFLQYKTTLVNECRKLGSLRLANARTIIKIDVNKTRKIYDLLMEEGLINKDL